MMINNKYFYQKKRIKGTKSPLIRGMFILPKEKSSETLLGPAAKHKGNYSTLGISYLVAMEAHRQKSFHKQYLQDLVIKKIQSESTEREAYEELHKN